MGTCVICGKPTEGRICSTHEEDVYFEFHGNEPADLTPGRYYRGTVDGFAEFGVFVDIGPTTGLLHRSEIPQRLESLEWDPGDAVFVQVLDVHPNGNIDLGWSIRQRERDFRGHLHDPPEAAPETDTEESGEATSEESEEATSSENSAPGATPDDREVDAEATEPKTREETEESESAADATTASPESAVAHPPTADASSGGSESGSAAVDAQESERGDAGIDADAGDEATQVGEPTENGARDSAASSERTGTESLDAGERTPIGDLESAVDEDVVIEGSVAGVRQTSGPTIFEVTDESGTIDCAAFEEAGVRAYPTVEVDDVIRLEGEVERRRGELQIETEALTVLTGEEGDAVRDRLRRAMDERAAPTNTSLLVDDPTISVVQDDIEDAATAIRRAVIEARPIIIRHTATLDGYVAGTALERALLPLIREEHAQSDAEYHYVDRRPLDDEFYRVDAATGDVTDMLEAADRHDEKHPLFLLVDAGSTRESTDGLELLDIYDAPAVVVDGGFADAEAAATANVLVSPTAVGADPVKTGTLGTHLAALVNDDVREDLRHLPATSYWSDRPARYEDLAAAAGYALETLKDIRNAVTLEAFYQSYEDKRELIADLFWGDDNVELAAPISEQFEEKLESQLDTAIPHLERRNASGLIFDVLDVDDFTHQYDFPPVSLLIDALHRRREAADGERVTLGVKTDEIHVRSSRPIDVRDVVESVDAAAPDAGVTARGGRDGRIEFLAGERDAVVDATVEAIATQVS
ncbi:MAG: DHH family phosphoesterase [Halanaeroarchaeum sp.]